MRHAGALTIDTGCGEIRSRRAPQNLDTSTSTLPESTPSPPPTIPPFAQGPADDGGLRYEIRSGLASPNWW